MKSKLFSPLVLLIIALFVSCEAAALNNLAQYEESEQEQEQKEIEFAIDFINGNPEDIYIEIYAPWGNSDKCFIEIKKSLAIDIEESWIEYDGNRTTIGNYMVGGYNVPPETPNLLKATYEKLWITSTDFSNPNSRPVGTVYEWMPIHDVTLHAVLILEKDSTSHIYDIHIAPKD